MENIVLYPNATKDPDLLLTKDTAKYLFELGFCVYAEDKYFLGDFVTYFSEKPKCSCDLMIVIGGDGTIIDAMPMALSLNTPVLGINLGKVGYLSELEPTELSLLEGLRDGRYSLENALLLDVEFNYRGVVTQYKYPILNDLVVSRKIENTIASLRVCYNGAKALDYRADGVIVSTPLGSTAYSLSCGGPMISRELDAILMTPICPHSFLNRSMVFPDTTYLQLKNTGENNLVMIADGRSFAELAPDAFCTVKKSKSTLKFLSLKGEGHLQTIFRKLRKIQNI